MSKNSCCQTRVRSFTWEGCTWNPTQETRSRPSAGAVPPPTPGIASSRFSTPRTPIATNRTTPPLPPNFSATRRSRSWRYNNSPDIGFDASINAYRGCEHGCIYCYARPTHEYLGFSAGLDFETKILVKPEAATLLRRELSSRRWKPQVVVLSGVTDPYQPAERRLKLTRACLEVLAEFRNPVSIITKNHLVTRDIDVLGELARHQAISVALSVTSLHGGLARVLEPRASHPQQRLAAIETLSQAGVPVGMMVGAGHSGAERTRDGRHYRGRQAGRGAIRRLHDAAIAIRRRAAVRALAGPARPEQEGPKSSTACAACAAAS